MKAKRVLGIGLLAAGLLLSALTGAANAAEGVWIGPDKLAAQDRATLVQAIGAARGQDPTAFETLARLRDEERCEAVVLGCTELPLIIDDASAPVPTLDSTRLLARAALERAVSGSAD